MISSLKRQGLYEVSIGLGKESYEYENDWIIDGGRAYGTICEAFSPSLHYLIDSGEYPKDLQTKLDRTFGKHNEDHNGNLDITQYDKIYYSKFSSSTLFDEVVQYEEEVESSPWSIRIEENLIGVTPSPASMKFYEISDISSSHIYDPKEDIRIYVTE